MTGILEQLWRSAVGDRARRVGLAVGAASTVISLAYEAVFPGRILGDPLPLALAFNGVQRILVSGLLYFDWRSPLVHILFAAGLGIFSAQALRLSQAGETNADDAVRAASTAAVLNVGLAALLEVDSLMVGFFYLIAGLLSVYITSFFARRTARYLRTRNSFSL